jgi:hypothetical protein
MGKRSLLKMACTIGDYNLTEINEDTNEKEIRKFLFDKLRKGFEGKRKQVVLVESKI